MSVSPDDSTTTSGVFELLKQLLGIPRDVEYHSDLFTFIPVTGMNISRKYERKLRILSRNSCKYENEIFFKSQKLILIKLEKTSF